MPHIRLEYTANIQTIISSELFDQLFKVIIQTAKVKSQNCKSRAIKITNFHTGSKNDSEGFVHLEVKILKGRSEEIRNQIGMKSLKVLQTYFKDNKSVEYIQYSMEIQEINPLNYFT